MPGAMSVLEDTLSRTASRFSRKRDAIRIGALQEYCVLKVVGWRTQAAVLRMNDMLTPHSQHQLNKTSHPISLMKAGGHYDSTGTVYLETSEFLSILKLNASDYLDQLEPLCSMWSIGEPKLITLTTIETFYYPHGYVIHVHSSLGKSEFKMKPSDSTLLLHEFCKDELSHLCEKILKVSPNDLSLEDVQIFVGDDLSISVLIHESVLLVHVIDETFAVQIKSYSLAKLVHKRSMQNSLCSSIGLEDFNDSMRTNSFDEDGKVKNTIHLSGFPPFPFDLKSSDRWSPEILLRYVVEVMELSQCKDEIIFGKIDGADFLLQTAKFQSLLCSLPHPLHRVKLLEHSDRLLLEVLNNPRAPSVNDSLRNLSSMELASILLRSYGVIKIPLFIARKGLNGENLSRQSEEEILTLLSSIDEVEAMLVIQHFPEAAEIAQGDEPMRASDASVNELNPILTHEPSDDQMIISCEISQGFDDDVCSRLLLEGRSSEAPAATTVFEPHNISSFQFSESLQCSNVLSGIPRIFSHPTLLEDDGLFSVFEWSVIVVEDENRTRPHANDDCIANTVDLYSPSETISSSQQDENIEVLNLQEVRNLGYTVDSNVESVTRQSAAIHTTAQALAESAILTAKETLGKVAMMERTNVESKLAQAMYLANSECVESQAFNSTSIFGPIIVASTDSNGAGHGIPLLERHSPTSTFNINSTYPNQFADWMSFLRRVRSCFARYPSAATLTADAALVRFIQLGFSVLRLVETLSSAKDTVHLAIASSIVRSASRIRDVDLRRWSDELATEVAMVTCFVCNNVFSSPPTEKKIEVSDYFLYLLTNHYYSIIWSSCAMGRSRSKIYLFTTSCFPSTSSMGSDCNRRS